MRQNGEIPERFRDNRVSIRAITPALETEAMIAVAPIEIESERGNR